MENREIREMNGGAPDKTATLLQQVSPVRTERLTLAGDRIIINVHGTGEKSEFAIPLREIDEDYVECRMPALWAAALSLAAAALGAAALAWPFYARGGPEALAAGFLIFGGMAAAAYSVFRREIWPGRVFWRFGPVVIQVCPRPKEGDARIFAEKMLAARHEAWKKDMAAHAPLAFLGAEISIAEEIKSLHELVGLGVLTKDEFEMKKKELLEKLARYVPDETDS